MALNRFYPSSTVVSQTILALLCLTNSSLLPEVSELHCDVDDSQAEIGQPWAVRARFAIATNAVPWPSPTAWVEMLDFGSVCALDASRTLRCLIPTRDDDRPSREPVLTQSQQHVLLTHVRSAVLSDRIACVLREEGDVWCWLPIAPVRQITAPNATFCGPQPQWLMRADSIFATDHAICARRERDVQCVSCSSWTSTVSKHLLPSASAPVICGIPHALCQQRQDGRLECDGCVANVQAMSIGDPQLFENLWWTAWDERSRPTQFRPMPRHFVLDPPRDWSELRWGLDAASLRALGVEANRNRTHLSRPPDAARTTPNWRQLQWCGRRRTTSEFRPVFVPLFETMTTVIPLAASPTIGQVVNSTAY